MLAGKSSDFESPKGESIVGYDPTLHTESIHHVLSKELDGVASYGFLRGTTSAHLEK